MKYFKYLNTLDYIAIGTNIAATIYAVLFNPAFIAVHVGLILMIVTVSYILGGRNE